MTFRTLLDILLGRRTVSHKPVQRALGARCAYAFMQWKVYVLNSERDAQVMAGRMIRKGQDAHVAHRPTGEFNVVVESRKVEV